ncbi:MAG: hypothetical protein C0179_05790 [Fervidicoccus sp.]|nr:MAG: hypothetical protein C0179_05790 [Fervidicoccus sp.]
MAMADIRTGATIFTSVLMTIGIVSILIAFVFLFLANINPLVPSDTGAASGLSNFSNQLSSVFGRGLGLSILYVLITVIVVILVALGVKIGGGGAPA